MSIDQDRLDLAGTREFASPGQGPGRRERLAAYNREVLAQLWQDARKTTLLPGTGVALAVVGGIARRDSGPLSDFDVVLLHDGRGSGEIDGFADQLWYPLWDRGVRLDHSVRSPKQCRAVASDDLSAAVGLLDIEHVCGDPVLVAQVRQGIAHDWRANARKRLPELVESLHARHARQGDLTHELEPNLKEAAGGLRDMAVLRALAATWLADRPHGTVDTAYDRLLDVRDALHVVTGRGRDRLTRQDQDAVAALLGEPDADTLLTSVVQAGRTISYALEGTVRRAGQSQRARTLRTGPRRPVLRPLGHGLYLHDGEVVLGQRDSHRRGALMLLRAATAAARRELPLGRVTVANLTDPLPLLEEPWPEEIREAFVDLLAAGPGLTQLWETLDLTGVVGAWLPEWAPVRSRPQRSPVHRHTVDRHLIETVVAAGALRARVQRPDLLLVAALLHDIGKIAGVHDHATEGAPVAGNVARRMGFATEDVEIVELLVREHLTVVDLATRRDPEDPRTVDVLVAAVEERADILELLVALTEADALAAGPKAWTSWRAELVHRLAQHARAALDGRVPRRPEETAPVAPEIRAQVAAGAPYLTITATSSGATIEIADQDRPGLFAAAARLLASFGMTVRSAHVRTTGGIAHDTWRVEAPLGDLPDVEQLARSLREGPRTRRRNRSQSVPPIGAAPSRATVVPGASDEALVIEVRALDRAGLLGDLGEVIAAHGLAIRSAHVATYAGQAVDTFYLTKADDTDVSPPHVAQLIGALIDACDGTSSLPG